MRATKKTHKPGREVTTDMIARRLARKMRRQALRAGGKVDKHPKGRPCLFGKQWLSVAEAWAQTSAAALATVRSRREVRQ